MECRDLSTLIHDLADGSLEGDERKRAARHVDECPHSETGDARNRARGVSCERRDHLRTGAWHDEMTNSEVPEIPPRVIFEVLRHSTANHAVNC